MTRFTPVVVGALLLSTVLVAIAPAGAAFDSCTAVDDKDCDNYLVCVGRSTDQYGNVSCRVGVITPCSYCVIF